MCRKRDNPDNPYPRWENEAFRRVHCGSQRNFNKFEVEYSEIEQCIIRAVEFYTCSRIISALSAM